MVGDVPGGEDVRIGRLAELVDDDAVGDVQPGGFGEAGFGQDADADDDEVGSLASQLMREREGLLRHLEVAHPELSLPGAK